MSKSLKPLIAALMLASAGHAVAASSVDLTVRGLITPSACEPTLSNGGMHDLGKIASKDLNVDQQTSLPNHYMQIAITCEAATLVALESKDNRADSHFENDIYEFGLGMINESEKLGALEVKVTNPVTDGLPARMIASEDGGATWFNDAYLYRTHMLSVADGANDTPRPFQVLTADLRIKSKIAPTSGLTLNNEAPIDGSVTLTVRYL